MDSKKWPSREEFLEEFRGWRQYKAKTPIQDAEWAYDFLVKHQAPLEPIWPNVPTYADYPDEAPREPIMANALINKCNEAWAESVGQEFDKAAGVPREPEVGDVERAKAAVAKIRRDRRMGRHPDSDIETEINTIAAALAEVRQEAYSQGSNDAHDLADVQLKNMACEHMEAIAKVRRESEQVVELPSDEILKLHAGIFARKYSHMTEVEMEWIFAEVADVLRSKVRLRPAKPIDRASLTAALEALRWYASRENWKLVDFSGEIKERIEPSDLSGEGYMTCSGGKPKVYHDTVTPSEKVPLPRCGAKRGWVWVHHVTCKRCLAMRAAEKRRGGGNE